jgi:mono/diheme cytochrome c family protein
MSDRKSSRHPNFIIAALCGAAGLGAVVLLAAVTVAPRPAAALPAYAQQTGEACGACHSNPAGGGKLTARGEAFKKNKK